MLNKNILNNKYKQLISLNTKKFIEDVNMVKSRLALDELDKRPLLIYSKNLRNPVYYVLCMYNSLKEDRILDYQVITGQTFINQHFMSEDQRDNQLFNSVYYSDIAFISLSEFDYTSDYLENLLIDLVEFRQNRGSMTVISYDIIGSSNNYSALTKKLHSYFSASGYQIRDLVKLETSKAFSTSEPGKTTVKSSKSRRLK